MSLDRVPGDDELYIGGLFSLRRYEALKKANITHVVSALRLPLDQDLFRNFKHHVVDIDDVEDENIIQHFAASNAFIKEGLEGGGGVLVHCAMGKSRSVTLMIAYLLSTLPHNSSNTPGTILSLIRQSRPFAEPNPGFMSQLDLYHSMAMPSTIAELDAHPIYQRWLYQRAVEESNSRGVAPEVGEIRFADTTTSTSSSSSSPPTQRQQQPQQTHSTDPLSSSPPPTGPHPPSSPARDPPSSHEPPQSRPDPLIRYRCRRCRHQLATSAYLVEHHSPPSSNTLATTPSCAHLFLDPLSWMRPELELGKLEGRLECPNVKCGGTSVGRYAWQGLRCSCGAWVVPGVCLARGKVDEVRVAVEGIRRPPGGGKM